MFTKKKMLLPAILLAVVLCLGCLYSCTGTIPGTNIGDGKVNVVESGSFQLGVSALFTANPSLIVPVNKVVSQVIIIMDSPDYVPGDSLLVVVQDAVVLAGIPENEEAIALEFFQYVRGMVVDKIGKLGNSEVTPEMRQEVARTLFGLVKKSCDARLGK